MFTVERLREFLGRCSHDFKYLHEEVECEFLGEKFTKTVRTNLRYCPKCDKGYQFNWHSQGGDWDSLRPEYVKILKNKIEEQEQT